jgi:endonuclease III
MASKKEQILAIALDVLRANPEGIRFSDLVREVTSRNPDLNLETTRYYCWDLPQRYPDLVQRPARGVIQLVEHQGPPLDPPTGPAPAATAGWKDDAAGRNKRTFIYGRDGQPVSVLLPIEDYEALVALQAGGGLRGSSGESDFGAPSDAPASHGPQPFRHPPGMSDAEALAAHIRALPDFTFVSPEPPYGHMAATLVDSILQRGMNYEKVVLPRVHKLRDEHPEAATTSGFAELMQRVELAKLIAFRGEYVLATIRELTELLLDARVETEDELRVWLEDADNRQRLARVSGVGPKTGEFLRLRCGARDAVAVDRWLIRMLEAAGVDVREFWGQHKVITDAAGLLGVPAADLEESTWSYMSKKR